MQVCTARGINGGDAGYGHSAFLQSSSYNMLVIKNMEKENCIQTVKLQHNTEGKMSLFFLH
jgi:hypothetical protein